jgi:multidrug efflux pump subunit AcrB
MFSHFFIERPIFASVLSIVITLAGAVAAINLPVAQYPPITPPSIMVMCNYPGANAQVVADSVAAPIEQQINGVEDMLYMVSQSNNDGSYTLTVTFKPGVNLNFAQVLVQNRINLAMPLLPDVVKQAGVTTRKRNPDIMQVIAIYSPSGRYDQLYLSNFATIKIRDELARVEGVGDCQQFGQQDYCMRLWVDPDRLAALNMTAGDVAGAVREQNAQVASGHFGQEPTARNTLFEFPITTRGRLTTTKEFEEIVLRTESDGRKVLLKDVGNAELGARNMDSTSKVNFRPNASLAVFALPEANAIAAAGRVREKMEQLKKSFPEDIDYVISLDLTPFIQESINEVVRTLIEAVILVAIVVLVFLQNWRTAIIPLVAVPVAIIGTFAVMIAIGFSLNNLTLFGLILAIGIVVDDAIVVVEAVEHHIEHGLTPRQAAHKAMDQVSGPVIAVALVLSAVFVPCAFISGITGQFFRQFALTIAVSTIISAFNSLTLSPALAAILLKPRQHGRQSPVPRLAAALIGAGLGFVLLARGPVWVWGTSALVGAVAGLLIGPRLMGWLMAREGTVRRSRGRMLLAGLGAYLGAFYLAPWAALGVAKLLGLLPAPVEAVGLVVNGWVQWWGSGLVAGAVLGWFAGPVLTSLLLQALRQGIRAPLPRLAFAVFGGWLAWTRLRYLAAPGGTLLVEHFPAAGEAAPWLVRGALAAGGAVAGWIVAGTLNWFLGWFFAVFNLVFHAGITGYSRVVGMLLRTSVAVLACYGGLIVLTLLVYRSLPEGYIPNQDQGRFYIAVQLPDAASMERTQKVADHIAQVVRSVKGVEHITEIAGQSFTLNANGSNFAQFFCTFEPFENRRDPSLTATALCDRVRERIEEEVPEAKIAIFTPPAVSGLGGASGFKIIIEDRGDLGFPELQKQIERVIAAGNSGRFKLTDKSFARMRKEPDPVPEEVLAKLEDLKGVEFLTRDLFDAALEKAGMKSEPLAIQNRVVAAAENRKVVGNLFSVFRANTPQLYVDLDREQCQTLGVNPRDVFDTLQIYLGSYYVNDFNRFGRTWQVVVQARGEFRTDPSKIKELKVRNADGEMVPLGALLSVHEVGRPINIGRYNMYPAGAILGLTQKGVSTGQGIAEMEAICQEVLPPGMAFEWTEINFMQIDASKNIWNKLIFPLAVAFVFLVLAAQYESWALPLAVILVVPMCVLGSLTGVAATDGDVNIFTQIGFVVLVGLASKNAILIVEFAKHKREDSNLPRREATLEACKLRLRPILMTSFAFILGVLPLITGHGAGAEMRRVLGVAVFSGMLGVTLFGIFLTPVFFYVIEGFVETPLFSSERMRLLGNAMLHIVGILTLGLFWLVPFLLGKLTRRPAPEAVRVNIGPIPDGAVASTNGHAPRHEVHAKQQADLAVNDKR